MLNNSENIFGGVGGGVVIKDEEPGGFYSTVSMAQMMALP